MARQFDYDDIAVMDLDSKKHYWFECAMVSTCEPVFDGCESNYEVEEVLRQAKVILPQNQTDSESCALVVQFSTPKSGEKFIDRLNAYLAERDKE